MADEEIFSDAMEDLEGSSDDIDDAADDANKSEETSAEEKEEIQETKENMDELKDDASTFKDLMAKGGKAVKAFATFVVETVATAAIFYAVNTVLAKLLHNKSSSSPDKQSYKKKQDMIKAINQFIQKETKISKNISTWMKANQDKMINLDGFDIPMESLFEKYLTPIKKAVQDALDAARKLMTKKDGKTTYSIPNAGDLAKFVTVSQEYFDAFSKLEEFVTKNSGREPILKELPLTASDIGDLKELLDKIKSLPVD